MPEVSSNLATLGASGWVPNANWGAINGVPVTPQAATWATRASYQQLGRAMRFTDVGGGTLAAGGGTVWIWNGTRWKPQNGNVLLDAIDTANPAVASAAEQQLNPNHAAIPAGVIQQFDRLWLRLSASKDAAVDTCTLRLRFGPLGTTADPVLTTITALAGTGVSLGVFEEFKRITATSIQKQGNANSASSFNGADTGAFPAAVAVSDMDANIMYFSLTSQLPGGTEIATIQNYTLELYATDS